MDEYLMDNGIVDVRIDDRMIHGIVATQWIPTVQATRAMVVNESVSHNDMIRSTIKMATPAGVALSCIGPEKAIENFKINKYAGQRVFVVGRDIKDIYEIFKGGVKFKRLNLGDVTQNLNPTLVLGKTVRITDEEKGMLKEMRDAGVQITVQFRTTDSISDVGSKLD